ncbi:MAG: inositol monophosphatase [Rhodospirillales bacterium]|nr:inositol monophosphatase [Rhodospirillales bacterium]
MNKNGLDARFELATTIVREASDHGMRYFRGGMELDISSKGVQDVVSNADREMEEIIKARLSEAFPEDGFFGEESGRSDITGPGSGTWVVDPIDGTDCFIAGIPVWCVSIAYVLNGNVEIGVIYDPNAGEMFAARRGGGAMLNGETLRPRTASSLGDGVVSIGYSTRRPPEQTMTVLDRLLANHGMFQRNGSGALALAYVAAGRYIGFFEAHINAWDCLAGIALIRESGGWTNDFLSGNGLYEGNALVAAVPGLEPAMREISGLA